MEYLNCIQINYQIPLQLLLGCSLLCPWNNNEERELQLRSILVIAEYTSGLPLVLFAQEFCILQFHPPIYQAGSHGSNEE